MVVNPYICHTEVGRTDNYNDLTVDKYHFEIEIIN